MKLSIITVSYNSARTIRRTIDSVVNQKDDFVEYIVIDGNSTDGTQDIVQEYGSLIDVFISEPDRGISDAFNKGILIATGDVIGIINSDDEYIAGAFEYVHNNMDDSTDVYYGNGIRRFEDMSAKRIIVPHDISQIRIGMPLLHPSTFVTKKAYEEYGMFDEKYKSNMDRELFLRMYTQGAKFRKIDKYLSVYNMGGMSDRNYYKSVLPESYEIDVKYGLSKPYASYVILKSAVKHFAVEFRSHFLGDRRREKYDSLLQKIHLENQNSIERQKE